jgi:hypothetical protein
MNPLALQDLDNEVLKEADQYLRDHKILELFEVSWLGKFRFFGPLRVLII